MPLWVGIDDRALGTLEIPDAQGEINSYSFLLLAFSPHWSLQITRADSGESYRVEEDKNGHWSCACKAEKFRKRGQPHCKHIQCVSLFCRWLRELGRQGRALASRQLP
jgi:hypothetical protein